jgi:hypothetical protein
MTRAQAEIIVCLAKNDMNAAKTAQKLRCHKNTILYHIGRIAQETGANPKRFCDLCRLLPMATEILQSDTCEAVDFEIVTRCGNCKYWLQDFGEVCAREEDWFYMSPDDFCSRGTPKE